MKPLFGLFWQICVFRKGPDAVPYSTSLLGLLVIACLMFTAGLIYALDATYFQAKLLGGVLGLMGWMAMLFGLLSLKKASSRWVQTMSACLGTDLVMGVLVIPLQWLLLSGMQNGFTVLGQIGLLMAMIWDILIKARIYESAMSLDRFQAVVMSVFIWLTVWVVSLSFLPAEAFQQT